MVYTILDYWVLGFYPSSDTLKSTTFRKLYLLPSSWKGDGIR
jgi:hypothetical protein